MTESILITMAREDLTELIATSIQKAILNRDDQWFTHREACKYLKVDPSTLHRMKRDGKVTYSMIDSSPRYRKADLTQFLEK